MDNDTHSTTFYTYSTHILHTFYTYSTHILHIFYTFVTFNNETLTIQKIENRNLIWVHKKIMHCSNVQNE